MTFARPSAIRGGARRAVTVGQQGGTMQGLTILATFHGEGALARMTLNGLARCGVELERAGVAYEVLCVMDAADRRTHAIVAEACEGLGLRWRRLASEEADLGSARNRGIDAARYDHVCIVDGDDYYTSNWPLAGYEKVINASGLVVAHPEFVVDFGMKEEFTQQIDQEGPLFSREGLLAMNFWVSTVVASRECFLRIPYRRNRGTGFGFEDWTWNCDLVAAGGVHSLVPGTAIFYRRKNNGMLAGETASRSLLGRTSLFSSQMAAI